jgi:hypothetical protein
MRQYLMNCRQTAPDGAQLTDKNNDLAALVETLHDYLKIYGKPAIFSG